MPDPLLKHFNRLRLERREDFTAERAVVATTATQASDDVFVTLPNSEAPNLRTQVEWRLAVKDVAGTLHARYPTRGDEGCVFYDDEGQAWLIY
jgi:hypothetical protein